MKLKISGITVDLTKKNIKNIHLSVIPPHGEVRVAAPLALSDEAIRIFVRTKGAWIKAQQEKFASQPRLSEREYISGESIFIFGRHYYLRVESGYKNGFVLDGQTAILTVRETSTVKQRENYVNSQLRQMLAAEIAKRLPEWEAQTALQVKSWQIRIMRTKWGSCSPEGRLLFNLMLVHTPLRCLDYVILHEILHLQERHHNNHFFNELDKYMPFWPEVRSELNGFILAN